MKRRKQATPDLRELTHGEELFQVMSHPLVVGLLLFLACMMVYSPIWLNYKFYSDGDTWWDKVKNVRPVATDYQFIWDDDQMVSKNPMVRITDASEAMKNIWDPGEITYHPEEPTWWKRLQYKSGAATDFFPLTNTAFWVQWQLWKDQPYGYHVVNIVLHALATVMFWLVLRALRIPGAALGGLLFGLHPVCVSSVTWVSELKNTLSMVPFMAAFLFWVWFEDTNKKRWYLLAMVMFLLSMLAKSSPVMFPVVLLLLAWWRRGKITRQDVVRSIPFFLVSLLLGLMTVKFQTDHSIAGVNVRPEGWASRLAASGWVVWFYVYKIFLPINLSMIYPRWVVDVTVLHFLPLVALVAAFVLLFIYRKKWGHSPLAASVYFVLTLAPVLGFITMSFAKHTFVADHWQYVSVISIIALVAGGSVLLWRRLHASPLVGVAAAGVVVLLLSLTTWLKIQTFENVETVCRDTLKNYPEVAFAHNNLGFVLANKNRVEEAFEEFKTAIRLKLDYDDAENNVGVLMDRIGNYAESERHFRRTLEINPRFGIVYPALFNLYMKQGKYDQAKQLYLDALKVEPDNYAYRVTLAWLLATCPEDTIRNGAQAVKLAQEACDMCRFGDAGALNALAAAYAETGNYPDAIKTIGQAITLVEGWKARVLQDAPRMDPNTVAALLHNHEQSIRDFRSRQDMYRENRPFRATR